MTHNLLKGKRGIIFGALNEESIDEGCQLAVQIAEEDYVAFAHLVATKSLVRSETFINSGKLFIGLSK